MSSLTFAGISSDDVGVRIERYPSLNRPSRKYDRYVVPGRNGDIIEMQDAWNNYVQEYNIFAGDRNNGAAPTAFVSVSEWLFKSGYQILEDTYETDYFRKAIFVGPMDVENVLSQFGRCTIQFECMPQRFLWSGQTTVTKTASGSITNPTAFTARPLITVNGSGSGTITCGSKTLSISSITSGMIIDSENQDAYDAYMTNLNNLISGDFPEIPPGTSTFGITGGITSVVITPNYWTL